MALLTGCGAPAPDLFVVQRTGSGPGAELNVVIRDDGAVRCAPGRQRRMSDAQLLRARTLARDLEKPATNGVSLAPGPRSVLSYVVITPAGRVRFSDSSPSQPAAFPALAALTREIARGVCGFPR
jgi:hypothetical protein